MCAPAVAWAQTLTLSVRVPEIEVGQSTQVIVTVAGVSPVGTPELKSTAEADVRYRTARSEFLATPQTGIVRVSRYEYLVTPRVEGELTIGPARVFLPAKGGGIQEQLTDTVTLRVGPAGSRQLPDEPLRAEASFSTQQAWEGQVVLYTAQLAARVPVAGVGWSLPPFDGLARPPNGDAAQSEHELGDPKGPVRIYEATLPFVATGTGDRSQPPAVARVDVLTDEATLFGRRRRQHHVAAEQRAALQVRPLPPAPPEFSGLVGEFELASELARDRALVGQSVKWTVQVAGDGVADGYQLTPPALDGVQVYQDDDRSAGRLQDGRYLGSKRFELTLVPTRPGTIEVPPLDVLVFSPRSGRYETLRTAPGKLHVTGEAGQVEVRSFGGDDAAAELPEAPVEPDGLYRFGPATLPPLAPAVPLLLLLVSAPGGLVLFGEGVIGARAWLRRRSEARAEASSGRPTVAALPASGPERLAGLDATLRAALERRVGVGPGQLRRADALDQLPEGLRDRVQAAFAALDRARFAGGVDDGAAERMALDAIERLT